VFVPVDFINGEQDVPQSAIKTIL